jgi:hypothetical protein
VARRTAIPAVLASLALIASAACSSGSADRGSAGANPTLATDPPRTNPTLATVPAPTTTTNPYAVPAVIDAAYVNQVLAALDKVLGDAIRSIVAASTITTDGYDRLRAVFGGNELLQSTVSLLEIQMREGFREYKRNPGNRSTTVDQLITANTTCIFARVRRDYSAVDANPGTPVNPQWIALRRLDSTRDAKRYNPTPWAAHYDGFLRDRSEPPNQCSG